MLQTARFNLALLWAPLIATTVADTAKGQPLPYPEDLGRYDCKGWTVELSATAELLPAHLHDADLYLRLTKTEDQSTLFQRRTRQKTTESAARFSATAEQIARSIGRDAAILEVERLEQRRSYGNAALGTLRISVTADLPRPLKTISWRDGDGLRFCTPLTR